MTTIRTLPLYVFRTPVLGDCTNDGISGKYDRLNLVCDNGFLDVDEDDPSLVKLVPSAFGGVHVVPVAPVPRGHVGYMFGGNYAAASDSRFREAIADIVGADASWKVGAVAIHDRSESQELNAALSR